MSEHMPLTKEERGAICMAPEMAPPAVIIRLLTDLQNTEAERDALLKAMYGYCLFCTHVEVDEDEEPCSGCHHPKCERWQLAIDLSGGAK